MDAHVYVEISISGSKWHQDHYSLDKHTASIVSLGTYVIYEMS